MPASQPPKSDSSSDNLTEWTSARDAIDKFDGYVNDLRKYGFTLVTGLLAVTGYLSSSPAAALSAIVKLGVTVAILTLVVTLAVVDAEYRSLQRGASTRARILEWFLNVELTSSIAHYVRASRFRDHVMWVYVGFASSTFLLGATVLWGFWLEWVLMLVAYVVALAIIVELGRDSLIGMFDWSVGRKLIPTTEPVRIVFTNLIPGSAVATYNINCQVQRLDPQQSRGYSVDLGRPEEVRLPFMGSRNWLWKTDDAEPGLYEIRGIATLTRLQVPQSAWGFGGPTQENGGWGDLETSWEVATQLTYHRDTVRAREGAKDTKLPHSIHASHSIIVEVVRHDDSV